MTDSIQLLLKRGYEARRVHLSSDAKGCFVEAVDRARECGDTSLLMQSLAGLGRIERDLGETALALQNYREAAEVCRSLNDPLTLAHTVRHVGDILRESGELGPALPCYEEALEICRSSTETNLLDLANTLRGFALLDDAQGRKEDAIAKWREAGELYDQVWRLPDSPYSEADLAPGVAESQSQITRLSAS